MSELTVKYKRGQSDQHVELHISLTHPLIPLIRLPGQGLIAT